MLRVDASNLPSPRGLPRSRRLLPRPPAVEQPAPSPAEAAPVERHEFMLPPPDASAQPPELDAPQETMQRRDNARWSVRLELGDEEIAKLYGQGMARGAVVWRQGMVEWRPLLITPELSALLRHTRTTLTSTLLPPDLAERAVTPTTVAPTAMDVTPAPHKPRRSLELAAVALAAFALAWIGREKLLGQHAASSELATLPSVVTPHPAACEPVASPAAASQATIPTVAVTDLPLAGATAESAPPNGHGTGGHQSGRAASADGNGPSRASLVSALSRVAQNASGCGERGGPVRVVMSFSPTGVARSIQVSGADLPASTRSCIIAAASRARVPAFSGDPVTVSKTL
ncbi:MAG TPA: hypothetical protein VHB79_08170 [Polyangiaceae bacterium]|nr:hypothetical protein [Polyangiaceae bacterium]